MTANEAPLNPKANGTITTIPHNKVRLGGCLVDAGLRTKSERTMLECLDHSMHRSFYLMYAAVLPSSLLVMVVLDPMAPTHRSSCFLSFSTAHLIHHSFSDLSLCLRLDLAAPDYISLFVGLHAAWSELQHAIIMAYLFLINTLP